ncbi:hypothetical protein ES703_52516 [subsurface metagenome]
MVSKGMVTLLGEGAIQINLGILGARFSSTFFVGATIVTLSGIKGMMFFSSSDGGINSTDISAGTMIRSGILTISLGTFGMPGISVGMGAVRNAIKLSDLSLTSLMNGAGE